MEWKKKQTFLRQIYQWEPNMWKKRKGKNFCCFQMVLSLDKRFLKYTLLLCGLKTNSSRGNKVWSLSEGRKVPSPVTAIGQQELSEHYVIHKHKHTETM